jgi:CheY-like chemotaxis protein
VSTAATAQRRSRRRNAAADLIVLDLELPAVSGFDVAKRLRANPETQIIPSSPRRAIRTRAARSRPRAGFDQIVIKPCDPDCSSKKSSAAAAVDEPVIQPSMLLWSMVTRMGSTYPLVEQMTTDTAVLERALVVMAIAMAVQTLLFMAARAAFIAWRERRRRSRTRRARPKRSAELRVYLDRMSLTVDETARALRRGTSAGDDLMSDVRDAMGTVRNSVGTVASAVSAPRAALAFGLWRGIQFWRKRRAAQRIAAAATSEL